MRHSKIDQEDLLSKFEDWKKESPQDMFYLRPVTSETSNSEQQVQMAEDEDDIMRQTVSSDKSDPSKDFRFVHQTLWKKNGRKIWK